MTSVDHASKSDAMQAYIEARQLSSPEIRLQTGKEWGKDMAQYLTKSEDSKVWSYPHIIRMLDDNRLWRVDVKVSLT